MKKIKVNDMSCMHCVKKIQTSLLSNEIEGDIDLMNHEVSVKEQDLDKAVLAIKDAGYTPEV
ncbi:MAG: heavy metal-associated domain-containing protein [Acholeplasma sp.]|nr:heavy metal-associated domain-containing protein [Acholeplasma sp.]